MRPRRPGLERGVEIQFKMRVEHQVVMRNPRHMNLVVAFGVNLAKGIFIQEIVADHQPLFRASVDLSLVYAERAGSPALLYFLIAVMWLLVATARCCLRGPAASRMWKPSPPEGLSYRRIPSREVEEQDFRVLDTG